ncbi:hypothetical protein HMPREF7545_1622 [Selenomonas noxia ATCC 43541]|nr:hypothetical protein HMPREF7545_1622 [Selenomonas noxia ATCC 43541]
MILAVIIIKRKIFFKSFRSKTFFEICFPLIEKDDMSLFS